VGDPPRSKRHGPRRKKIADHRDDIEAASFPPFWREALDDMMLAYDRTCAYMAVYIEKVTGAPTVDHMIPRSVDWRQVYEWNNYRLACSLMNARKTDAVAVLDPVEIQAGWFELELVGFQVKPSELLRPLIRDRVERTITRLKLNNRDCRDLRESYSVDYWNQEITLNRLERRAPFIAIELRRQGRLLESDR
jgi:hypothetical protein